MEQALQLVVVFLAALATGGLLVNWIGLGRAMSRLSGSTYVEFHQATNHTFNPYMPIVVVGAILGGIVLAILSPGIDSLSGALAVLLDNSSTHQGEPIEKLCARHPRLRIEHFPSYTPELNLMKAFGLSRNGTWQTAAPRMSMN